jgi:hypothetical protein
MLTEQRAYQVCITDVAVHQTMIGVAPQLLQAAGVPGICQQIEIDDGGSNRLSPTENEIRADETRSARNQNGVANTRTPRSNHVSPVC